MLSDLYIYSERYRIHRKVTPYKILKSCEFNILSVNWTKSFNCPGVVGQDAVKFLNTSLQKVVPCCPCTSSPSTLCPHFFGTKRETKRKRKEHRYRPYLLPKISKKLNSCYHLYFSVVVYFFLVLFWFCASLLKLVSSNYFPPLKRKNLNIYLGSTKLGKTEYLIMSTYSEYC